MIGCRELRYKVCKQGVGSRGTGLWIEGVGRCATGCVNRVWKLRCRTLGMCLVAETHKTQLRVHQPITPYTLQP